MARQVTIRTLCDVCLNTDTETDAEELPPLNLVGTKARILALCDEHRTPYDDLVTLVKEFGQTVDIDGQSPVKERVTRKRSTSSSTSSSSDDDGEYQCPECEKMFSTPQGMGAHRFRAHGVRSQATAAL